MHGYKSNLPDVMLFVDASRTTTFSNVGWLDAMIGLERLLLFDTLDILKWVFTFSSNEEDRLAEGNFATGCIFERDKVSLTCCAQYVMVSSFQALRSTFSDTRQLICMCESGKWVWHTAQKMGS